MELKLGLVLSPLNLRRIFILIIVVPALAQSSMLNETNLNGSSVTFSGLGENESSINITYDDTTTTSEVPLLQFTTVSVEMSPVPSIPGRKTLLDGLTLTVIVVVSILSCLSCLTLGIVVSVAVAAKMKKKKTNGRYVVNSKNVTTTAQQSPEIKMTENTAYRQGNFGRAQANEYTLTTGGELTSDTDIVVVSSRANLDVATRFDRQCLANLAMDSEGYVIPNQSII